MGYASRSIRAACLAAALAVLPLAGAAHPHVWVDGGVSFRMGEDARLEALEVRWHYDEFETLYTLSALGLGLNAEGDLDPKDRAILEARLSDWPDDFDGSAHLTIDGAPVPLAWPSETRARLVDGRLELRFVRALDAPVALTGRAVEVAFYESTYFFAFSVTDTPEFRGVPGRCSAEVIPFDPDEKAIDLQATLAALSREETPSLANVGALFADRITVSCV